MLYLYLYTIITRLIAELSNLLKYYKKLEVIAHALYSRYIYIYIYSFVFHFYFDELQGALSRPKEVQVCGGNWQGKTKVRYKVHGEVILNSLYRVVKELSTCKVRVLLLCNSLYYVCIPYVPWKWGIQCVWRGTAGHQRKSNLR